MRKNARFRLIVTDGVFSMDGPPACPEYVWPTASTAIVAVDDCHATSHLGDQGRGTPAPDGRRETTASTSSPAPSARRWALMGGFIAASQPIIDLLRQRTRPYLFSNSLAPAVAAGSLKAIEIAHDADPSAPASSPYARFREGSLTEAGFTLLPGETPIISRHARDAVLAQRMAEPLTNAASTFAAIYPVVPQGKARIRTQMSAALTG